LSNNLGKDLSEFLIKNIGMAIDHTADIKQNQVLLSQQTPRYKKSYDFLISK
jgi:hypothetical protein